MKALWHPLPGFSFLIMTALTISGCAERMLANQGHYIDENGVMMFVPSHLHMPRVPGQYIVWIGKGNTDPELIDELFGQYNILSKKEVFPPEWYGKTYVRWFLIELESDPGWEKMFDLASKATGFFKPYINVTPNRSTNPSS